MAMGACNMKWQWGVQEVIGNSNREKGKERKEREGKKGGYKQTNYCRDTCPVVAPDFWSISAY